MTLQGKNIDINNFKSDVMYDVIEEYRLDFEDTRDGKRELSNPKEFSQEKCTQRKGRIYNYFSSWKNSHVVTLSHTIRKDTPSPEDRKNRYVKIIYKASLVEKGPKDTQGKFLYTQGTDLWY